MHEYNWYDKSVHLFMEVVVIFIGSNFVILQHLKGYENYACDKTQTRGRRCLPKTFVSFYICECQIKSKVGTTLGSQRSLQSSLCKRKTNNFLFEIPYVFCQKYYFDNNKRTAPLIRSGSFYVERTVY